MMLKPVSLSEKIGICFDRILIKNSSYLLHGRYYQKIVGALVNHIVNSKLVPFNSLAFPVPKVDYVEVNVAFQLKLNFNCVHNGNQMTKMIED